MTAHSAPTSFLFQDIRGPSKFEIKKGNAGGAEGTVSESFSRRKTGAAWACWRSEARPEQSL